MGGLGSPDAFLSHGDAARGDAPAQHASLRFRLRCASEGPPRLDVALVADGSAVAPDGHDARDALPRALARWARMQVLTGGGELAVHRAQVVDLGDELAAMCT